VHFQELRKSSNTARIAERVLGNCRLLVRGGPSPELGRDVASELDRAGLETAALLFPAEHARELREWSGPQPEQLIVPDGTWSQARRLARRYPVLQTLPALRLPEVSSVYRLRRGSAPGQLCTSEAIATALHLLGEEGPARALMQVLFEWQARALAARTSEVSRLLVV
jgi:DTW domain-containing protein YfiP